MKTKLWTVCVAMISTSLLAQQETNPPPAAPIETPAPAAAAPAPASAPEVQPESAPTNAPAARPANKSKKPAAKHASAAELRSVPLVAGPAVVSANRVNVRGKAGLRGEIVARLTNGEPVTVIEEIKLAHSGPEEPSAWAKIVLPTAAHTWVKTSYIDPETKKVKPKKLNLRSGPGENYSVIGSLQRGDEVRELATKGDWTQVEPATTAYAFVAAQYLTQEPAALAAAGVPMAPGATNQETLVASGPAVAEAATSAPEMTGETNEMAMTETNAMAEAETNEVVEATPPPPRIVQREGIVRYTVSIQAPTTFELINAQNHKTVNWLFSTSPSLDLNRYKGLRVIVTGEEGLDERWPNVPIITIQRIQVLE
jgi:uncharacterized protein YgiM (DUF1202 family)